MSPVTVVIAARQRASRSACLRLLQAQKGIRVVGAVRTEAEAFAAAGRIRPRVLLLDFSLFRRDGARVLSVLRERSPRTKVILLTDRASEARILDGLSRGALGYLERRALRTYLAKAVRAVNAGEAWVPRKMVAGILGRLLRLIAPGSE
jgi:DNA-binding NarL/FixJ family response regulator